MIPLDAFLKGVAAGVCAAFGAVVLAGAPRRAANQFLAFFLALLAMNQGVEAIRALATDDAARRFWFRVASVPAALDPPVLLYFASIFPRRNALNRLAVVVPAFAAGTVLAVLPLTFVEGSGAALRSYATALTLFTAVLYTIVAYRFVEALRERPGEPGFRAMVPAVAVATLPVWMALFEPGVLALVEAAPTLRAAASVWYDVLVLAAVACFAAVVFAVARSRAAAGSDALLVASLAAAWLVCASLQAGFEAFGRAGAPVRWLLFGAFVSVAVLRHDALEMPLAGRRLAARVLVGAVLATAAVVAVAVIASAQGSSGGVPAWAFVLVVLALALSQGFRALSERVAARVYGVPAAGDPAAAVAAYREAATRAIAAGRDARHDGALARLRGELDIPEATARAVERMAEDSTAGPLLPGTLLAGRYRVGELVGRGGHGRSFRAVDETLDRDVVLKELLDGPGSDAADAEAEARLAASVLHPGVVTVFDVLRRPGATVLVQEVLEGGSLQDRLTVGALDAASAERILLDLAEALAAVHARGVVHCDVKPANVLLTANGRAKLADFGVARLRARSTDILGEEKGPRGTLGFVAPELHEGSRPTPASDVWSFGVLARAVLPAGGRLDAVVDRALRADPGARYRDGAELVGAVRAALGHAQ